MLPRRIIALLYIALCFCANAAFAQDLSQLPRDGDMRGLVITSEPVPVSDLPFVDEDEVEGRLSEYRGKYVVLNFWATWCAPCREEMPSLEALQRQFGSDQFEVVTLATGRNSPQAIRRFFEEIGVENLSMYRDINQQIARQMSVMGLPITLVIDPQGREIARLMGDAHWDSPEAFAFFEALLAESS
ncbi:MAG: TlpA disulfide reductase family protein [Proteobacteria bacterium]|nr:TlpA disulfide reductase family protein [Pseudomonadota bacterium]